MILRLAKLHRSHNLLLAIVVVCGVFGVPLSGVAQQSQRLSVTPALVEMSSEPGQFWESSLRVVNPNPYPLTVYVEVVNFTPRGEGGDGLLLSLPEAERTGATIAEWITVSSLPYEIAAEQTVDVPFSLQVPQAAAPGGHFAAFTVSTRPPAATPGASQIRTSQVVTSLFFVRIAGEVVERGSIREFRPERRFLTTPEVTLGLRFENDGNVHLRPQGNITITNMWGQERGVIPINRQAHFGNVLPNSIRKFSFTWEGDIALADIGRYQAAVTLAYGQDARQFVTSITHFWIIPLWPLIITLGSVALVLLLAVWLVRWYVRRMLAMAGYAPLARRPLARSSRVGALNLANRQISPPIVTSRMSVGKHVRSLLIVTRDWCWGICKRAGCFIRERSERQRVIAGSLLLLLLLGLLFVYLRSAFDESRSFQIRYDDSPESEVVTSDQIAYENLRTPGSAAITPQVGTSTPSVAVINVSGIAGAGATVAMMIEAKGYVIERVETELGQTQGRTVIVYDQSVMESALALSADLENAPLSAFSEPATTTAPIIVYVGSDIVLGTEE